jgi:RimJ/RimL family protein N-acetyltransferase
MLSWRNQEANRQVSAMSHVISPEEHLAWWHRVEVDPSREVHLFVIDGRPLGVVSYFDLDLNGPERTAGWGFYLDHDTTTAEGIAMIAWLRIMGAALDHAFDVLGLDVLIGEVLAHNEPVRLMNRRFRFTEGTPEVRESDGRSITAIPIRLARADRRPTRAYA